MADERVHPNSQLAGLVSILVGGQSLRWDARVVYGGEPGTGQHLGHQFDALLALGARGRIGNLRPQGRGGPLLRASGQFPLGVAFIPAARRIGRLFIDIRERQGAGVEIGRVAAPVRDRHGIIGGGGVQVGLSQATALGCLGVVEFEADHPFPRPHLLRTLADGSLDRGNGSQIAVDVAKMAQPRAGHVQVGVDESRHDCVAADIDLLDTGGRKIVDFLVRAHGKEPVAGNGDGLGPRVCRVHRVNRGVIENEVWLGRGSLKSRRRPADAYKCATRRTHLISFLVFVGSFLCHPGTYASTCSSAKCRA